MSQMIWFLLLSLLALFPAPIASNHVTESQLQAFERWFSSQGGIWGSGISPAIEPAPCTDKDKNASEIVGSLKVITSKRQSAESVCSDLLNNHYYICILFTFCYKLTSYFCSIAFTRISFFCRLWSLFHIPY